ncbi:TolB family protein [Sphingomonas sp. DT-204]|uniref:TolB family protein n=1 Tax=Sphingomonas sp. DT-204 TaxID=3396166 RepID=UPI003F1BEF64
MRSWRRLAAVAAVALSPAALAADTGWVPPPPLSTGQFESHPAFDPLTGDVWFVRSKPDFSGWRILYSRCGPRGWEPAQDTPIAGDGLEADPVFTDGGRRLWFISSRSTDGIRRKDMDIWTVVRGADDRWGTPERLPAPVNSEGQEWFPRPAPDGWLYFGSNRPGGAGKTDIWRARRANGRWTVENAGPAINGPGDDYEPLVSPDGTRMLIATAEGYYESRRGPRGWQPRTKLGPDYNVNGTEIGALFAPDGKAVLIARDVGGGKSGELVLIGKPEPHWPPCCGG